MIVDAIVLLYAVDAESTFHAAARAWLEETLNGPARAGLPWASLLAFQRISTHPRASPSPLSPGQAWSYVDDWLGADATWVPMPGDRHAARLPQLIVDGELPGNLATDAHPAA